MQIIKINNFDELQKVKKNENKLWDKIADLTNQGAFPLLAGGLDRIEVKPKSIYVYDMKNRKHDNSYIIRGR